MYGMVLHLLTNEADPVHVAGVNQKYKNVYSNSKAYLTFIPLFIHIKLNFNLQEMTNFAKFLKVNFQKIDYG